MKRIGWVGFWVATLGALFLGYHENKLRIEHAKGDSCKKLRLGEENPLFEQDLQETLPGLLKTLAHFMEERAAGHMDDPKPLGRYKRVQHPAAWGCVPAIVEIFKVNITDRYGIFSRPATYKAVVRLSKNSFDPDNAPKTSSVAIKLFGVKGQRAWNGDEDDSLRRVNADTQDLIMIGSPTLPVFVIPAELEILHARLISFGLPGAALYMICHRPTLIPRLAKMLFHGMRTSNPLLSRHYSVHSSRLGDGAAFRYGLFPCNESEKQSPAPQPKFEYIHDTIKGYLEMHDGCMKLMIQKQTDPCIDQIDDVLNEWVGPWQHVGNFRIDRGARLDVSDSCDNLAFNPFHALEENKPLGWVSRMRREVYAMGSALRTRKNREHNSTSQERN